MCGSRRDAKFSRCSQTSRPGLHRAVKPEKIGVRSAFGVETSVYCDIHVLLASTCQRLRGIAAGQLAQLLCDVLAATDTRTCALSSRLMRVHPAHGDERVLASPPTLVRGDKSVMSSDRAARADRSVASQASPASTSATSFSVRVWYHETAVRNERKSQDTHTALAASAPRDQRLLVTCARARVTLRSRQSTNSLAVS